MVLRKKKFESTTSWPYDPSKTNCILDVSIKTGQLINLFSTIFFVLISKLVQNQNKNIFKVNNSKMISQNI
jgi:hypothetical protein